ncbi:hypothetical protein H1D24_39635 [Streptomyces sp. PSKA28]|uniref:Flp pilus assembly protein RcpC/CpaB domain-containing protein n=1 Tax=Streptomyces himalayensis subsp. himalayensis TaxID=2756131 RepID=A0A7W0IE44_9ACTN|nr:hypothetical protein [Streptomyces himalayensis subsp. himalayensis]
MPESLAQPETDAQTHEQRHGPPGGGAPPTCEVPHFSPVRVRGGRHGLRRLVRHRRRAVAAGLAVTAAALVATGPRDVQRAQAHPAPAARNEPRAVELVAAPVRIADAATVRLLRPGDRVDVVAADGTATGGAVPRVVAKGARVTKIPEAAGDSAAESGALVVFSVPRTTAARLAGAGATARLAVTLC